jgi:hypothetical protein
MQARCRDQKTDEETVPEYRKMSDSEPIDPEAIARRLELMPVPRLFSGIREADKLISGEEARFLVDAHYRMQKNRIRTAHQTRTLEYPSWSSGIWGPGSVVLEEGVCEDGAYA